MTTASTLLTINAADASPPFEQIRRQLALLVETDELVTDERLPSVRQLAADLGVSNGTVARAYRELEAAEVVTTQRGGGTRVSPAGHPRAPPSWRTPRRTIWPAPGRSEPAPTEPSRCSRSSQNAPGPSSSAEFAPSRRGELFCYNPLTQVRNLRRLLLVAIT